MLSRFLLSSLDQKVKDYNQALSGDYVSVHEDDKELKYITKTVDGHDTRICTVCFLLHAHILPSRVSLDGFAACSLCGNHCTLEDIRKVAKSMKEEYDAALKDATLSLEERVGYYNFTRDFREHVSIEENYNKEKTLNAFVDFPRESAICIVCFEQDGVFSEADDTLCEFHGMLEQKAELAEDMMEKEEMESPASLEQKVSKYNSERKIRDCVSICEDLARLKYLKAFIDFPAESHICIICFEQAGTINKAGSSMPGFARRSLCEEHKRERLENARTEIAANLGQILQIVETAKKEVVDQMERKEETAPSSTENVKSRKLGEFINCWIPPKTCVLCNMDKQDVSQNEFCLPGFVDAHACRQHSGADEELDSLKCCDEDVSLEMIRKKVIFYNSKRFSQQHVTFGCDEGNVPFVRQTSKSDIPDNICVLCFLRDCIVVRGPHRLPGHVKGLGVCKKHHTMVNLDIARKEIAANMEPISKIVEMTKKGMAEQIENKEATAPLSVSRKLGDFVKCWIPPKTCVLCDINNQDVSQNEFCLPGFVDAHACRQHSGADEELDSLKCCNEDFSIELLRKKVIFYNSKRFSQQHVTLSCDESYLPFIRQTSESGIVDNMCVLCFFREWIVVRGPHVLQGYVKGLRVCKKHHTMVKLEFAVGVRSPYGLSGHAKGPSSSVTRLETARREIAANLGPIAQVVETAQTEKKEETTPSSTENVKLRKLGEFINCWIPPKMCVLCNIDNQDISQNKFRLPGFEDAHACQWHSGVSLETVRKEIAANRERISKIVEMAKKEAAGQIESASGLERVILRKLDEFINWIPPKTCVLCNMDKQDVFRNEFRLPGFVDAYACKHHGGVDTEKDDFECRDEDFSLELLRKRVIFYNSKRFSQEHVTLGLDENNLPLIREASANVCIICFAKHGVLAGTSCELPGWAKRSCCKFHSGQSIDGGKIRVEYREVGKQYTVKGKARIWDGDKWTCIHHNKNPRLCFEGSCPFDNPSGKCAACYCKTARRNQRDPLSKYCADCRERLTGIKKRTKRFEDQVSRALKMAEIEWSYANNRLPCAQTIRYPDFVFVGKEHVSILEVDENGHRYYNPQCEIARISELMDSISHANLHVIRFNPHSAVPMESLINAIRASMETNMAALSDTGCVVQYMGYSQDRIEKLDDLTCSLQAQPVPSTPCSVVTKKRKSETSDTWPRSPRKVMGKYIKDFF